MMDSKLYGEIGKAVEYARKNGGSLTEQNLLYVVKLANDISSKTGADFDMLLGEGVIAMMKAEQKYDKEKNDCFAKSTCMSVRGYMLNAINRQTSLVHVPANHMQGFKKGQARLSKSKIEYSQIDASNYDTLGTSYNDAFLNDRDIILQDGLKKLDINGRIAIEMKLRIGKYAKMVPDENNPDKMVYQYQNNLHAIAEELEVPVPTANKIYKDAFSKLSTYCQKAMNE